MEKEIRFLNETGKELGALITINGKRLSDYSDDEIDELIFSEEMTEEKLLLFIMEGIIDAIENDGAAEFDEDLRSKGFDVDEDYTLLDIVEFIFNCKKEELNKIKGVNKEVKC